MKLPILYFRYNVYNNNNYNMTLHNVLMEHCYTLPLIFYKIVIKYVCVSMLHYFYEDLINISFDVYNYRQLADKICCIDKNMINNGFKILNFKLKGNNKDIIKFKHYYESKNIKCLSYHDNTLKLIKYDKDDIKIEILELLHKRFKARLIINYILFIELNAKEDDQTYDNFDKDIVDKKTFKKLKKVNLFPLMNNETPLYRNYFNKKKHD